MNAPFAPGDLVDGVPVPNPRTGELELVLLRDDYAVDDLDLFTEDNVLEVVDWQDAADGKTIAVHNPATGKEIGRVAHAMEPHEGQDPVHIGIFGADAVVQIAGTLAHLIELPEEFTGTHADALTWAKKQGGELPTRKEQALLFATLKCVFKEMAYWSNTQHAAGMRMEPPPSVPMASGPMPAATAALVAPFKPKDLWQNFLNKLSLSKRKKLDKILEVLNGNGPTSLKLRRASCLAHPLGPILRSLLGRSRMVPAAGIEPATY